MYYFRNYLFIAFEMTLEEGLNLEKRFFHQTFGTVSMVLNKITCILRNFVRKARSNDTFPLQRQFDMRLYRTVALIHKL